MSDYDIAVGSLLEDILAGKNEVANRTTLGSQVPIQLFQALRLVGLGTAMESTVGAGASALVYRAGQDLGMAVGGALKPKSGNDLDDYLDLVKSSCNHLRIGAVVVEKVDLSSGEMTIRVDECVSCAGIQDTSAPLCNFEAGLVGGFVRAFVGVPVRATETRCSALGDSTCGVDVTILG